MFKFIFGFIFLVGLTANASTNMSDNLAEKVVSDVLKSQELKDIKKNGEEGRFKYLRLSKVELKGNFVLVSYSNDKISCYVELEVATELSKTEGVTTKIVRSESSCDLE